MPTTSNTPTLSALFLMYRAGASDAEPGLPLIGLFRRTAPDVLTHCLNVATAALAALSQRSTELPEVRTVREMFDVCGSTAPDGVRLPAWELTNPLAPVGAHDEKVRIILTWSRDPQTGVWSGHMRVMMVEFGGSNWMILHEGTVRGVYHALYRERQATQSHTRQQLEQQA